MQGGFPCRAIGVQPKEALRGIAAKRVGLGGKALPFYFGDLVTLYLSNNGGKHLKNYLIFCQEIGGVPKLQYYIVMLC